MVQRVQAVEKLLFGVMLKLVSLLSIPQWCFSSLHHTRNFTLDVFLSQNGIGKIGASIEYWIYTTSEISALNHLSAVGF